MVNHIDGLDMYLAGIVFAGLLCGLGLVVGTDRVERPYHWIVRQIGRLQPLIRVFFGF
ncbi:MAG: hypothetical protein Q7K26_04260 [bacterium]|nr:hypothetical protein [bacterium]